MKRKRIMASKLRGKQINKDSLLNCKGKTEKKSDFLLLFLLEQTEILPFPSKKKKLPGKTQGSF